jgi:membrane associated rhomboid family serine protease
MPGSPTESATPHPDSPDGLVAVFRGTRTVCLEFALVLEAKSLAYELVVQDGGCALLTHPAIAAAAREELERYAAERAVRREEPVAREPLPHAAAGAIGYAGILLSSAYCAGANLFGADWLAAGAVDAAPEARRQWWRAFTALTLHLDQAHLFSNLLFGIVAGVLCSRLLGAGIAWLTILCAGAAANLLELWIAPVEHRSVGASTAVFAALGLLTGYAWRQRLTSRERWIYRWTPLLAGVSLLAFLGAGSEHVDVLGHLLGFGVGVLIGWLYARAGLPRSRSTTAQIIAGGAALTLIIAAWALALQT